MKPALLVIDLQRAYYKDVAARTMDRACLAINRAIRLFRERGLPLLWIQHLDEYDGALPGKEGFEFIEALEPAASETRIVKTYNNSFNQTGLAGILAGLGVDTVVVSGYCAEYCIIASYWGARNHDLDSLLLRGGVASDVEDNIRAIEQVTAGRSYEELEAALKG
jgi:nicotinamidase-related amidase